MRMVKVLDLKKKTIFVYGLIVALVVGLIGPVPISKANGTSSLLSMNRSAYASSTEGGLSPQLAVDGNLNSRWSSSWGVDPQWIYIDLGAAATIDRVALHWENSYATAYQIQVSNDEYSWTTIYATEDGDGGIDDITLSGQGRYVRMLGLERSMQAYGYSLFEFSIYGTGGISEPIRELGPNLALNAPAFSSSVEEAWYIPIGSVNPNKVVDGDPNTRWGSIHEDKEWIYVDLGSIKQIGTVILNWEAAGGRAYDLQVSNDANNWTTVYREQRGNGSIDEVPLYVSARYIKMQGIARLTSWGYSLREFEVYEYQAGDPMPSHQIDPLPTPQKVNLGGGSYLTNQIEMPHPKIPEYKDESITGPIASNDWWQSLLISPFGDAIITLPLKSQFSKQGLGVLNPGAGWINQDGSAVTASGAPDLYVMANHINAAKMSNRVSGYSDFAVDTVLSDDTTDKLKITFVKGSPYLYGKISDANALEIYSSNITKIYDQNGATILLQDGNTVVTDRIGIEITNYEEQVNSAAVKRYYGLFLPAGSTIMKAGGKLKIQLGNNDQYFSLAAMPSEGDLQTFYEHGYAHVVDTNVTYNYDEETSIVETQFNATTGLRRSGFTDQTLLAQYPHQWKITTTPMTTLKYPSIRGELKVSKGNTFVTADRFYGMVPQFTEPVNGEYSRTELMKYLALLDQDTSSNLFAADAYWQGKKLHPLAMGVLIADEIGATNYKQIFLSRMKTILEDWYTYTEGEPANFFYYEDEWGTVYYKFSEFGANSGITDHHFTYGYYVFASAVLAMYDEEFYEDYKDMVDLLIRDYGNPSSEDPLFPRFRSFDPYSGHSWAGGYADNANGNNQEAAGESLFGWVGQYLWSVLTENDDFRDAAIYGFTTELKAIEQYWFNYDGDNWHPDWKHGSVGQVYGSSYFFGTFFSGEPVHIYGIHWLPTAEWLTSFGFDTTKLDGVYNKFVQDNGGIERDWQHIVWPFQSISQPQTVLAKWNPTVMQQNEVFNAYWFVNSMASLGSRTKDIWATGGHSATVYKKGTQYRALVWNPSSESITVTFRNTGGVTGSTVVAPKSLIKVDPTVMLAPELDNNAGSGPEQPSTSINLALQKTVTASSTEIPFNSNNAVDGNVGTRWASQAGVDSQSLVIDLGSVQSFDRVVIDWETAYAKSYQLQVSQDGSNWNDIHATTTGDGGKDEISLTGTGRYIRLLMTERGTIFGYSLWEIEVWSATGVTTPESELISKDAVVTVSSVEAPFEKQNIVDGNNGTRWASAPGNNDEWAVIDLGQSHHLTELSLNWEAAYGTAYRIYTSQDGLSWNEVYSTTTGLGGVEKIPLTTTGRYIKFEGESRATIYGYSLWEFEVYGYK